MTPESSPAEQYRKIGRGAAEHFLFMLQHGTAKQRQQARDRPAVHAAVTTAEAQMRADGVNEAKIAAWSEGFAEVISAERARINKTLVDGVIDRAIASLRPK